MKWTKPRKPVIEREASPAPSQPTISVELDFPIVHGHPNRIAFEGCLTLVDVVSDKAPSGARGHRVILTRSAAEAALPSLLGMAVDYKAGWDGHDARQKCGIVTAAKFEGNRLMIAGFIFGRDYPEITDASETHKLGMSFELVNGHVEDMRASVWVLTRVTFTGAAILLRHKAAFLDTSFAWTEPRASRPVPEKLPEGNVIPKLGGGNTFPLCAEVQE